jgi:hypothetical protein
MTASTCGRLGHNRYVMQAGVVTLAVVTGVLSTTATGWFPPLPSVWILLVVAGVTRLCGPVGGIVTAAIAIAIALHTDGFTMVHSGDISGPSQEYQRVVSFALAALVVVALTFAGRSSANLATDDVWARQAATETWLIAELEVGGAVRNMNAAGARLLEHVPSDLRGIPLVSITHACDREQLVLALMRLRRGRRTEPISVRLLTATGRERSLVGRAFRVSEAGHVVLTAAIPERPGGHVVREVDA